MNSFIRLGSDEIFGQNNLRERDSVETNMSLTSESQDAIIVRKITIHYSIPKSRTYDFDTAESAFRLNHNGEIINIVE